MEETKLKLSIIVPVYNVLPYIRKCIDSLLSQTIEDFEIILIDDGSSDGTADILAEYALHYPQKIKLKRVENGGQGRARNIGMEMARGEFLGFIDSDDWIAPDMYEKLYNKSAATGADVVVCEWLAVYPDGKEELLPACVQEHWLASAGSASNKIFRREIVGDTKFPSGLWYEDFYFSTMLMLKANAIEYVLEPLYMYRQSPASTMRNNNSAKNLDLIVILDMLAEYMLDNGFKEEFEFFVVNHCLIDSINRVYKQNAPDSKATVEKLRTYARKRLPKLSECGSYRRESLNRRLIARLNYTGLFGLGRFLLDIKAKIS